MSFRYWRECPSSATYTPEKTLSCNAPILSTVSLLNIGIEYPINNYSGTLRHLKAHYDGDWNTQFNLSLTQWLDTFLARPNFETLNLRHPVMGDDATFEFEEHFVFLPSLRQLTFCESANDGARFLHHLIIPPKAMIDITFFSTMNLRRD